MTTIPILFCPQCQIYIGPFEAACFCGWQRPRLERLTRPGLALWQENLGAPARGRAVAAGQWVLLAWGNRQAGGGVLALERLNGVQAWKTTTSSAIEGGLVVEQEKVLFGTMGFLGQGAELRCHCLADGALLWRKDLTGGVWSAPVVRDGRVYVGCEDGRVHCFDLERGERVPRWPVELPPGRIWLILAENSLYALTGQGSIFHLDPFSGGKIEIASLQEKTNAGLAYGQGRLFAGTYAGRVYAIHLRERKARLLFEGCKSVLAAPCYADGLLYVGGMNHFLHALEAENGREVWRQDCQHSLASSPVVADGLVCVGGNSGQVYAFDARDGTPAWQYPLNQQGPVFGSPTSVDGEFTIGAENGAVCALPRHLGNYPQDAERLARLGRHLEAASGFAVASELETHDLQRKAAHGEAAMRHWKEAGALNTALRFRESLLGQPPAVLAREFEEAGQLLKDASLLRRAVEYYEEAGDDTGCQRCIRMAGQLSHAPYLSVHLVNLSPNWEAGEEGEVSFDIKNRGVSPAENIRIRLAGNLAVRLWVEMSGSLPPGESVEVVAKIVPMGPGDLVIAPHFTDRQGSKWSETRHFPFTDVKPPRVTLDVIGPVGALILDEQTLQGKIKIRGDVGLLRIKSVSAESSKQPASVEAPKLPVCPACGKPIREAGKWCQECGAESTTGMNR